jgi:hypothetical protein
VPRAREHRHRHPWRDRRRGGKLDVMSDEPTREARKHLRAVDWGAHPEADADSRRQAGRRTPDVQMIVAGLALLTAVVLIVLAF